MKNCFLNGKIIPLSEAKISVLDRGFLFGDGVYEVIPVYLRRLFCWERHMRRLKNNLAKVKINADVQSLLSPAQTLIDSSTDESTALYIQITRGVAPIRKHAFPNPPVPPTVMMMLTAVDMQANIAKRQHGVSCRTMEEFRWRRADIKSLSLLAAVLIMQEAVDNNEEEIILIRDGYVGEAAACNVLIVADNTVITPIADERILSGISRNVILELARQENIKTVERDITSAEMAAADEIWISSSTRELLPVTTLDGAPVSDGKPGAVYHRILSAFHRFIKNGDK